MICRGCKDFEIKNLPLLFYNNNAMLFLMLDVSDSYNYVSSTNIFSY